METPRLPSDLVITAVGATWVASRPGGLNITEWLQSRNHGSTLKSLSGLLRGNPPPTARARVLPDTPP